jgi:hypothetical protein
MEPLRIEYDAVSDIATIEGVKFSGHLLRAFAGGFPNDRSYRIVRSGDITTVRVYYDPDYWWRRVYREIEIWWTNLRMPAAIKRDIKALRRAGQNRQRGS